MNTKTFGVDLTVGKHKVFTKALSTKGNMIVEICSAKMGKNRKKETNGEEPSGEFYTCLDHSQSLRLQSFMTSHRWFSHSCV